jgi:hypothetical protein
MSDPWAAVLSSVVAVLACGSAETARTADRRRGVLDPHPPIGSIVHPLDLNRRVWLILIVLMFWPHLSVLKARISDRDRRALFCTDISHALLRDRRRRDAGMLVVGLAAPPALARTRRPLGVLVRPSPGAFALVHRAVRATTVRRVMARCRRGDRSDSAAFSGMRMPILQGAQCDRRGPRRTRRRRLRAGTLEQRLRPHTKLIFWDRGLQQRSRVIGAALIAGVLVRPMWSHLRTPSLLNFPPGSRQ